MNPCSDLAQMNALIGDAPTMLNSLHTGVSQRWLGRMRLIAEPYLEPIAKAKLEASVSMIFRFGREKYAAETAAILHLAIAKAEAMCGQALPNTGAVVQPGESFKAFGEIAGVIKSAAKSLFIVDPYMDETVLTERAVVARDGVAVRLLTAVGRTTALVQVAAQKWTAQFGSARPLEAKIAPKGALHDRLIFVDDCAVWQLSQSFKDFAARSPATVIPLDPALLPDKQAAYEGIWKDSIAL